MAIIEAKIVNTYFTILNAR